MHRQEASLPLYASHQWQRIEAYRVGHSGGAVQYVPGVIFVNDHLHPQLDLSSYWCDYLEGQSNLFFFCP